MDEYGVTIGGKEIYDEVKETSAEIKKVVIMMGNIVERMEKLERSSEKVNDFDMIRRVAELESRLDKQDDRKYSFGQKVLIAFITASIPVILGVLWFVAKGGGF